MQIVNTSGGKFNIIARKPFLETNQYTLQIVSKDTNEVILYDTNATFLSVLFYTTYTTTQTFTENSFYTLEISNAEGLMFKDMIFCTNKPTRDFRTTTDIYKEHFTGPNEYKYYTAP